MQVDYIGFKFSDTDVVNPGDWIPHGEYNPHNVRPFLLHDHGFVIAIVFADCLQDALDEAVDADKMDRYLIGESDRADYGWTEENGFPDDADSVTYLGNASEPFDIDSLGAVELPNPVASFCAQFVAALTNKV